MINDGPTQEQFLDLAKRNIKIRRSTSLCPMGRRNFSKTSEIVSPHDCEAVKKIIVTHHNVLWMMLIMSSQHIPHSRPYRTLCSIFHTGPFGQTTFPRFFASQFPCHRSCQRLAKIAGETRFKDIYENYCCFVDVHLKISWPTRFWIMSWFWRKQLVSAPLQHRGFEAKNMWKDCYNIALVAPCHAWIYIPTHVRYRCWSTCWETHKKWLNWMRACSVHSDAPTKKYLYPREGIVDG